MYIAILTGGLNSMTYKEESYVLDTLKEIQENIRSPEFKRLIRETHENNVMLRQIIDYLNRETAYSDTENMNDLGRNIIANLISNGLNISRFKKV